MPDRIWYLLSLKLSGEATKAELDEFYALLEANPELEEAVQQITLYWLQQSPAKHTTATPDLWEKHIQRMEQSGIEWAEADHIVEADTAPEIHQSPPYLVVAFPKCCGNFSARIDRLVDIPSRQ